MLSKVRDTYLFPNLNGTTLQNGCNHLSMLGLNLTQVSERREKVWSAYSELLWDQ